MARIHMFLIKCGVDPARLRFRQHMANEMAHYACDCWDAECLTSYVSFISSKLFNKVKNVYLQGWVECVGCADRSAYDLTQHTRSTGVRLVAEKKLAEPKIVDIIEAVANKGLVGKTFKKDAKIISDALAALPVNEVTELEKIIETEG